MEVFVENHYLTVLYSLQSPLGCNLTHGTQFGPWLGRNRGLFPFATPRGHYINSPWGARPVNRSLDNNTILQLDLFFGANTRVNGQRYLMFKSSFLLWKNNPLLQKCKLATVALLNTSKTSSFEFTSAEQSNSQLSFLPLLLLLLLPLFITNIPHTRRNLHHLRLPLCLLKKFALWWKLMEENLDHSLSTNPFHS